MMVTKKFKMRGLTLSRTMTFKAVLLFGFAFVLWHEVAGINHCSGNKNFSVPQDNDITLTCNISTGSRMFWWLYLDEWKGFGFCTFHKDKNQTCKIKDNITKYTLTSSKPLFSELTISTGDILLPKLDVRCSGPMAQGIRDYKEKQNCSIRVVGRWGQNTQDTTSVAATTVDGQRSNTDNNDYKDYDNGDDGGEAKLAAVVGGATGGVAVVIIVALVIVIVIVWKRRCDPLYAQAKTSASPEDDYHTYIELNDSNPQIMRSAQVTTQHENSTTRQQETYENDSAGNERGNSTERQYENTTTANQLQTSPEGLYEN